jgi:hypothetical protein
MIGRASFPGQKDVVKVWTALQIMRHHACE